ncbi:hypothetical protein BX616_009636 [Lobosporangium transversale]|nr:hypothetical protein BX616_009636 [Lobosporangium transversale]
MHTTLSSIICSVALIIAVMASTTSAYELWYKICDTEGIPVEPLRKKMIPGDTCVPLLSVDDNICVIQPHGPTGCKRYLDKRCRHKGISPVGSIYCVEP